MSARTGDTYGRELLHRAEREQIRVVVPTIDTELSALSAERGSFAEAGVRVLEDALDLPGTAAFAEWQDDLSDAPL